VRLSSRKTVLAQTVAASRLLLDLCLKWEQKAQSRTETFAPVLGLVLPALVNSELHLRPVHQAFLQVLSERPAHLNKGFIEVGKSNCSGYRQWHVCRTHANGYANRALHD
jgi:hypothetical protein